MITRTSPMESLKKTARFLWRHFFTLGNLTIGFFAFMEGPLNWKNGFYMIIAAAVLDWAKQFIKLTPNPGNKHTFDGFSSCRNDSNPSMRGTSAYYIRNIGS